MIRCVVFDFDGTLVRSDGIKRAGFFAVVRDLDPRGELMARVLAERPDDRLAIFRRFAEVTAAERQVSIDVAGLVEAYTTYCRDAIAVAEEFPGARAALATLSQCGFVLYANSATPDEALRELLELRGIAGYFAAAYGSHRSKLANLAEIARSEALTPQELVVVGNGTDDRATAQSFGCPFVDVGDGDDELSDLTDLLDRLSRITATA
jgi:phosphoglycolate phosphatase-like HAD superfamily hydrolase